MLHDVFVHLHKQSGTSWFEAPEGVRQFAVHPLTGRRVPPDRAGAVVDQCIWEPAPEHPSDYDDNGRVVLPQQYTAWMAGPQNTLGDLVNCGGGSSSLKIVSPTPGTIFFFDPDIASATQRIALRAEGAGPVEWSTDLLIGTNDSAERAQLREGVHVISARDLTTGQSAQTWIDVRGL